jgi:hypothetical protein
VPTVPDFRYSPNVFHGAAKVWPLSVNSGQTAPSGMIGSVAFDPFRKSSVWIFEARKTPFIDDV